MKILVVAPGHAFSTVDVYHGLCAGLRANGIDVVGFPLHDTLESMDLIIGAAKLMELAPPNGYPDPAMIATAGIPGLAMAKGVEWVIVVHGQNVPPTIPVTLRRGGYKTALLCTESPYQTAQFERDRAGHYDVVFTTERNAVHLFSENMPGTVFHLPHAYNPAIHTIEGPHADPCDVFLCGTRYPEREALLSAVDWSGIDLCDKTLHYKDKTNPLEVLSQVMSNTDVASYYRSARISLNHHRSCVDFDTDARITPGDAWSLNPRAFEIPACGGFMISDARADIPLYFGECVPTYSDADSLGHLIRYYLTHEDERRARAAEQQRRVLAHSWTARAADLLATLAQFTMEDLVWQPQPARMPLSISAQPTRLP